jgi:hypothetical protein
LQAYRGTANNQSALGAEYPHSGYNEQYSSPSGLRGSYPSANPKYNYGSSLAIRNQADANSEINYGNFSNKNDIIEKRGRPLDAESQHGRNNNFGIDGPSEDMFPSLSQHQYQAKAVQISKSSNILRGAPSKKQLLDPIGSGLESTNANEFAQYAGVVSPGTLAVEKSKGVRNQKPIIQLH